MYHRNLSYIYLNLWLVIELLRGPNGVWTLEQKGLKPAQNISFDDAIPTKAHMALKKLIDTSKLIINYWISLCKSTKTNPTCTFRQSQIYYKSKY